MKKLFSSALAFPLLVLLSWAAAEADGESMFDVRNYGATGDGKTLDTDAINKAIEAASAAGGGTVHFPGGRYLSFSIRLKSNIALHLEQGATLVAATPAEGFGRYDAPETNQWTQYQDFGHSHWHNSLIWGEDLENISILGPGLIDGRALTRASGGGGGRRGGTGGPGDRPVTLGGGGGTNFPPSRGTAPASMSGTNLAFAGGSGTNAFGRGGRGGRGGFGGNMEGQGNKAIGLKNCRNVTIRDLSMLQCGHFALLATGVDNLTIDNVKVDTNRDGFDIDCCRNVRISNCSVNAPNDDALVLKSSFALGIARATENVTIVNCQVSGYDVGSFLDGTFKKTQELAPDRDGVTGRIKFGTESNGGFKNITIANCVFDRCRGLALETVDGGLLEDISIMNITMRDIVNAPIFLRLGSRMRGPEGTPVGELRRINISNIVVYNADPFYSSIISGIPGHEIEDVRLSNIRIHHQGGGTKEDAALKPPERENGYPEPSMFGTTPAHGFFIRHVRGIELHNVEVIPQKADLRPAFVLDDVKGADFRYVETPRVPDVPTFVLKNVEDFTVHQSGSVPDKKLEKVDEQSF